MDPHWKRAARTAFKIENRKNFWRSLGKWDRNFVDRDAWQSSSPATAEPSRDYTNGARTGIVATENGVYQIYGDCQAKIPCSTPRSSSDCCSSCLIKYEFFFRRVFFTRVSAVEHGGEWEDSFFFSAVFAHRGAWLGGGCCFFFCLFQSSILHLRRKKEIGMFVSSVNIVLVLATYFQTYFLLLCNWKLNDRRWKKKTIFQQKWIICSEMPTPFLPFEILILLVTLWVTQIRAIINFAETDICTHAKRKFTRKSNGYAHLTRSVRWMLLRILLRPKKKLNNENKQTQIQNKLNESSRPQRKQRKNR